MSHNYEYIPYEEQCITNIPQIPSSVPLFTDPSLYHLTSYGVSQNFVTNNGKSCALKTNYRWVQWFSTQLIPFDFELRQVLADSVVWCQVLSVRMMYWFPGYAFICSFCGHYVFFLTGERQSTTDQMLIRFSRNQKREYFLTSFILFTIFWIFIFSRIGNPLLINPVVYSEG